MVGIDTADSTPAKQVGLVRASVLARSIVKYFADVDAFRNEFLARSLDIGDDQVESLGRARRRAGNVLAKNDREPGARRGKLHHVVVVTMFELGVEPPAE